MAMTSGPGNPLFDDPVAFLFTDGSALPKGTAGWGVQITYPERMETRGYGDPLSRPRGSPTGWVPLPPPATREN